jgi:hypothetical protein
MRLWVDILADLSASKADASVCKANASLCKADADHKKHKPIASK